MPFCTTPPSLVAIIPNLLVGREADTIFFGLLISSSHEGANRTLNH